MNKWKWKVRCYYSNKVKPPKIHGSLAIETVHATDFSKDMEVAAARTRENIGLITVEPYSLSILSIKN